MDRDPALVFIKLSPMAVLPIQGYEDDAGYDLYTSQDVTIPALSFIDIPTGVSLAMPAANWGLIVPRSSTIRKYGLRVENGIIDPGYRGEMFVGVWNLGREPVIVDRFTRLAQLIFINRVPVSWRTVDTLPVSGRGERGFGSSGK